MKKSLFLLITMFAFGLTNAQIAQFGFKVGLNVPNQSLKQDGVSLDANTVYGIQAGAFLEIKTIEELTIQPEVLFSTLGSKAGTTKAQFQFESNYVLVPIMIKYYPIEKLFIEAGPQIGFLTYVKSSMEYTKLNVDKKIYDKENFKSTDFAINFGVGFNVTDTFSAGIRYNYGLSKIAESTSTVGIDMKNSSLLIGIAYKI